MKLRRSKAEEETLASQPHPDVEQILTSCSAAYLNRWLETPREKLTDGMSAKLYAASERLREAVREGEPLRELFEICSNLLACEELAVFQIERGSQVISYVAELKESSDGLGNLQTNTARLTKLIERRRVCIATDDTAEGTLLREMGIAALVPLRSSPEKYAAIALFRFLPQVQRLDLDDREVLKLLACYAGQCLFAETKGRIEESRP